MSSYGAGYAPASIQACYDAIHAQIPSAINAGIYGPQPGYHGSRNDQSPSDYSVQLPDDQRGDPNAGCALDVTMYDDKLMKQCTQRLIDATKAGDKRIWNLREFFGTVDGVNVTGMDVRGCYYVTSDPSHLFHVHLSFYRAYACDRDSCLQIAEVFTGKPASGGDDMGDYQSQNTSKTQKLPTDGKWSQIKVTDDGVTITKGPVIFNCLLAVSLSGLPKGEVARFRFVVQDYKDGEQTQTVSTYPTTEIVGTSGGTLGQCVQYGNIGTPKSGWSRRLRVQASADVEGVSLTAVAVRSFLQAK